MKLKTLMNSIMNDETYDFDIEDLQPHPRRLVPLFLPTPEVGVAYVGVSAQQPKIVVAGGGVGKSFHLPKIHEFDLEAGNIWDERLEKYILYKAPEYTHGLINTLPGGFDSKYNPLAKTGERKKPTKKQRKAKKAKRRITKQSKRK